MSGDSFIGGNLFWNSIDARFSKIENKMDGIMKLFELVAADLNIIKERLNIE